MKRNWTVATDPPWKVWGYAFLMFILWFLCLFSFEITIGWTNGTETQLGYKGWGDRLFPRILNMLP